MVNVGSHRIKNLLNYENLITHLPIAFATRRGVNFRAEKTVPATRHPAHTPRIGVLHRTTVY